MSAFTRACDRLDDMVASSVVGKYFQLQERGSKFCTEMRAGTVTFLTLAYILAVNANILQDTGGTCTSYDCCPGTSYYYAPNSTEPSFYCRFGPPGSTGDPCYLACREDNKRSMISATAASALITTFLMGAAANMPLAICPGMGINAYFTYTVVGYFGTGRITYRQAIAACFVEGWIFLLLAVSGVRGKIIQLVPKCIMLATAGGIGLFLAFLGLQTSEGLGVVGYDSATLVTLAGCPVEGRSYQYTPVDVNSLCVTTGADSSVINSTFGALDTNNLGPPSSQYTCSTSQKMRSGSMWLGISGGVIMVLLMGRNYRGAVITGILFVTFVSWIQGHSASYLGATSQIPGGEDRWLYFKKVVTAPNISKTAVAMDWDAFGTGDLWAALITFLYLDFLDCTGTLFSMATFLNKYLPGFVDDKTKTFPRQTIAFSCDAIGIIVGSLMGIAPLTVFIESAVGIREGGRTGLVAVMVSFYFFLALFFTPIIASIPPYGTGPALIFVGALMMENVLDIDWSDVGQAVPAFLTIALIPLTYSIAYGVISGIMSYIVFYTFWLIYDLLASPFTKKPIREILIEAIPDAFKPQKDSSDSSVDVGKSMQELPELKQLQMEETAASVSAPSGQKL